MKTALSFIVFALIVIALLFSVSGKRSPRIPTDEIHKVVTTDMACMECHGPGMPQARKTTHPPKDECLKCHKVKRVSKK